MIKRKKILTIMMAFIVTFNMTFTPVYAAEKTYAERISDFTK